MRRLIAAVTALMLAGLLTIVAGAEQLAVHTPAPAAGHEPAALAADAGPDADEPEPLPAPDAPLPPGSNPEEVAAAATPSTVLVWSDLPVEEGFTLRGAGTGIVLTEDGLVLTNNHVVAGAREVWANDPVTGARYEAEVLGYDRTRDIAVLALGGASGLTPAARGEVTALPLESPVVALGNAGGTGELTTTPGVLIGLDRKIRAESDSGMVEELTGVIETAAPIRPGDSGGPLLDDAGRVIGVNTAASLSVDPAEGGGRGFAVPIDQAVRVAEQIRRGHSADTVHVGPVARLGVRVIERVDIPAGAEIVEVVPGSPADRLRLSPGDVITELGDRRVTSGDGLALQIDLHAPGDEVLVHWYDQLGNAYSAAAVLDEAPVG